MSTSSENDAGVYFWAAAIRASWSDFDFSSSSKSDEERSSRIKKEWGLGESVCRGREGTRWSDADSCLW